MADWNAQIIDEFRAHHGRVGGQFEGAPLILLHHRGRKSGTAYVSPVMALAHESDPDTIYVFASKAGAPTHPEWYRNLMAAGRGRVETGDGEYEVDDHRARRRRARSDLCQAGEPLSGLRGIREQDGWRPHHPGPGATPALSQCRAHDARRAKRRRTTLAATARSAQRRGPVVPVFDGSDALVITPPPARIA
jgi:deazaflavin-dependent oxidoreductase (nitroreductase family)